MEKKRKKCTYQINYLNPTEISATKWKYRKLRAYDMKKCSNLGKHQINCNKIKAEL